MNSVSGPKNWFSSSFTNNLIRLLSKQYLKFRHEKGKGQLDEGGGSILFNSDQIINIFLVCLFVCPFIPYLLILHGVQVQFRFNFSFGCVVDLQPLYIRTATETELFVC